MVKALVAELLSYLDLDARTEQSIYRTLVPRLERSGIRDPEAVYRSVTEWIDSKRVTDITDEIKVPYSERFHVRLDALRGYDDDRTVLTKYPDAAVENPLDILLQCEDGNEPNSLTFDELRGFLFTELPPEQYQLLDHLFGANKEWLSERRYDGNLLRARLPEIAGRLDATTSRFVDGHLLVPRKRVVAVNFDSVGPYFKYQRGYPDEIVREVYKLLLEGAGPSSASIIAGVNNIMTVVGWRKDAKLPLTKMSKVYPRISAFSESRLREAADKGMGVNEAAAYSGVATSHVRGFWKRIGHYYITPHQESNILNGSELGLSKAELFRRADITQTDWEYFLKMRGLEYSPKMSEQNIHIPLQTKGTTRPLEIVYPEKYRRIFEGVELGMNISEISRYAGVSRDTVKSKLKVAGVKPLTVLESTAKNIRKIFEKKGTPVTSSSLLQSRGEEITLGAVSNRLRRAYHAGLLERRRNGHGWLYFPKKPEARLESVA